MATQSKFDPKKFDENFTEHVINTMGPNTPPRARFVLSTLIRHIHAFAREVELTPDEWKAGVDFLNTVGQISTPTRNEMHRMSDVVGLESVVTELANRHISERGDAPTSSVILGPFWSPDAPWRENGGSIIQCPHNGQVCLMHGTVTDLDTGRPIPNVTVDIWDASSNGKYDFQDPEGQTPNNLRGKFKTNAQGKYHYYCLKPTAYQLPTDGPAGVFLNLTDRSPWRPAHIHLMVTHDKYKPIITQLYPKEDPHLIDDSVFAVKDDLVVDFPPIKDSKAEVELKFDMRLAPKGSKNVGIAKI